MSVARDSSAQPDLAQMKLACADLVERFVTAFDDQDVDGIVTCFADQPTFVRGNRIIRGRDELRAHFERAVRRFDWTIHTNVDVSSWLVGATRAHGITLGHAEVMQADALAMLSYRVRDTYVLQRNEWRIESRSFRIIGPLDVGPSGHTQ